MHAVKMIRYKKMPLLSGKQNAGYETASKMEQEEIPGILEPTENPKVFFREYN